MSQVFESDSERQAAYDFLEGTSSKAAPIEQALGEACAREAASHAFAFVAVDGVTLSLTDGQRAKGLGPVGGQEQGRGLKVINAIAVDPTGVPLGVAGQKYWVRPDRPRRTRQEQKRQSAKLLAYEKETRHWAEVIDTVATGFDAHRAGRLVCARP